MLQNIVMWTFKMNKNLKFICIENRVGKKRGEEKDFQGRGISGDSKLGFGVGKISGLGSPKFRGIRFFSLKFIYFSSSINGCCLQNWLYIALHSYLDVDRNKEDFQVLLYISSIVTAPFYLNPTVIAAINLEFWN